MSAVDSGRARRRGAVPSVRRSPRRTCRTVSEASGSAAPCVRCTCRMAVQAPSRLDTAIPSAARSVR